MIIVDRPIYRFNFYFSSILTRSYPILNLIFLHCSQYVASLIELHIGHFQQTYTGHLIFAFLLW